MQEEIKPKVALEAIQGLKTLSEIAQQYEILSVLSDSSPPTQEN